MAYNPNVPAPANLVQDDIAAMRENFQHLDPLAQAVGELQTVSGLAPVANELQTVSGLAQITDDLQAVSGLAPYVQAILSSRIVEMGSNSNGEYVRWENGFQICVGFTGFTQSIGGSPWTYPAAFVSAPKVLVSPMIMSSNFRAFMPLLADVLANQATTYVYDATGTPTQADSGTCNLEWIAVGRWK